MQSHDDQQQPVPVQSEEERGEEVFDLRNLGATLPDVLRHARAKGLSPDATRKAITDAAVLVDKAAEPILAKEPDPARRAARQLHYVQTMALFSRCMANQQYNVALAALVHKANFLDIMPPKQEIHTRELGANAASLMRGLLASESNREAIASLTHQEYGRRPVRAPVVEVEEVEEDEPEE
jgi:hypothetical protein